jgi:murein DD-endopeptidase MepM/ murein hydrolase activator NlpD
VVSSVPHSHRVALGSVISGLLLTLSPSLSVASQSPAGSGSASVTQADAPSLSTEPSAASRLMTSPVSSASEASAAYGYAWPVERRLGDGLLLLNYVDDNLATGVRDYENAAFTYDGHAGTDISLFHFRAMDRGTAVLAGRAGRVVSVEDGYYDRNTSMNGTTANRIVIQDDLGIQVHYAHLRNHSATVSVGENVAAGDVIGYIGSSGSSSVPHLHVEFRGTGSVLMDPWSGPSNPITSLWISQEPYVGFNPLRVFDIGMFTQTSCGGNANSIPLSTLEERLSGPARFGANEPIVGVWFLYQCQAGEGYHVEVLRPDGSVYASWDGTQSQKQQYAFQYYWWSWSGHVTSSQYGTWTARVLQGGSVKASTQFTVGATTSFAPRFYPVAGRTLRVDGNTVQDVLTMSSLGGPVTYRLVNAPSFVQLSGSTVTIPSSAHMTQRTGSFQVVATDAAGLADTMWYQLVDPRAARTVTDVPVDRPAPGPAPSVPQFTLAPINPNPFVGSARVSYALPARGRVTVGIVDVRGRLVRTLLDQTMDAGPGSVEWNALDDRGAHVPSGIYFVKASAAGKVLSRKLAVAR